MFQSVGVSSSSRFGACSPQGLVPARCLQGLVAILLWVGWSQLGSLVHAPVFVPFAILVTAVLLSADAVSDRPLCSVLPAAGHSRIVIGAVSGSLLALFCAAGVGAILSPVPITDQPVTLLCAAQDVRAGVIPYNTYEPQCYRQVRYPYLHVTPLESGPFAGYSHYPSRQAQLAVLKRDQKTGSHAGYPPFGYPPDAAVILVPVAFTSWTVVSLWVAGLCAGLLLLTWSPRVPERWLMVGWQLAGLSLPIFAFGWNPELVSYLLLGLAFAVSYRPRYSAVTLAAAVCTNPLTWVAAPVYLAVMSRYPRFVVRVLWGLLAGLVGVVPWLVWDHDLLAQLWRFLVMPAFPIGAALGIFAHLPSESHPLYFVGFAVVIVVASVCAWRYERWRWSLAVAVYLAFLVSWRGPVFYYFTAFWLAPAVLAGKCRHQGKPY